MRELGQRKMGNTNERKGEGKQNVRSRRKEEERTKKCLLHTQ